MLRSLAATALLVLVTPALGFSQTDIRPPESATLPSAVIERTYDFSDAIKASVDGSDLPAEQAREAVLLELFTPLGNNHSFVKRDEIQSGVFKVWATESYHKALPLVAEWIKHGKKQICIEARILTVPETQLRELHAKFVHQWDMSSGENATTPLPRLGEEPNMFHFTSTKAAATTRIEHISASATLKRSLPTRVALLKDEQVRAIMLDQQAHRTSQHIQAPKVTLLPGQNAVIKDTTEQPFVVSVKPIKGKDATAMQPIVKVIEEGLTIQLTASIRDDQVDLDAELKFNQIVNVDTFTFESGTPGVGTTVQIPEESTNRVRLSKSIRDGSTLLIDPHVYEEQTEKRRFRKPITTRHYTLVMITPRILEEN